VTAAPAYRAVLAAFVLVAEVAAAAYVALVVWVMSGWMLGDHQASPEHMTDADWMSWGCWRMARALVVAIAFALAARLAHRRWVLAVASLAWTRCVPFLLGACIAIAGAHASIRFMIERPFM
jgi:hypothetical protein